jgi:uncharacterized protein YdcH (DUF465 family)
MPARLLGPPPFDPRETTKSRKITMSSQKLRPIATAIMLGGLSTTALSALAIAADVDQQSMVAPGKPASHGDEKAISSAGAKVLRHIAKARDYVHQRNGKSAAEELQQASALLANVKGVMPTSVIKGQISADKKQLEQDGTTDLVPIATSLDELGGSLPVAEAKEHLDEARRDLAQGHPEHAMAELDAIDRSLVYTEVDLPLGATQHLINLAQAKLAKGNLDAADQALKAAEDEVVYLSVAIDEPLVSARSSLWRASQDHAAGAVAAAKTDLDRAIHDLELAAQGADEKTRKAIENLRQQVVSLRDSISAEPRSSTRLEEFWRRADALAQRSVEYFTTGWERLLSDSADRTDLIEAKLHLAYAKIDQFTAQRPDEAQQQLRQAERYLNEAASRSHGDEQATINQIRDEVARLGSVDAQRKADYEQVEMELRDLIRSA